MYSSCRIFRDNQLWSLKLSKWQWTVDLLYAMYVIVPFFWSSFLLCVFPNDFNNRLSMNGTRLYVDESNQQLKCIALTFTRSSATN